MFRAVVFLTLYAAQMACWATLFSHMSGFAIIRCSLDLQQLQSFKARPSLCTRKEFLLLSELQNLPANRSKL